jgi:hypothetical protein
MLVALYYDAERYPEPVRSEAREGIRECPRSVVDDEFPRMARSGASPATRARLSQLYALNTQLQPGDPYSVQLDVRVAQQIDRIAVLRDERVEASRASRPWTFWVALILGGVTTTAMGASLFMRGVLHQLLASFLLGMMIGSLLFLVLSLDRPFVGTTAITSSAFQRSLRLYSAIDRPNRPPPGQAAARGPAPAELTPYRGSAGHQAAGRTNR